MAISEDTLGRHGQGETLAAVSRSIVQLLRAGTGKGPTKCRTFWAGTDTMLVMLGGGFSAAERTLRDAGRTEEVLSSRRALQSALENEMRTTVEQLTGRTVRAFMSCTEADAELTAEIFVFEPHDGQEPSLSEDSGDG